MDCVGGLSGIQWRWVFFFIRVGFDGLCRWVEWDKETLGVFLPSGWELMDSFMKRSAAQKRSLKHTLLSSVA